MNGLKRCYTAFSRYRHSRGFGIHSPFAYAFVLQVLRERLPYYAYETIDSCRRRAVEIAASHKVPGGHRSVTSGAAARMIFRIACRFDPLAILQIGCGWGVSTSAMLEVRSNSRVVVATGGGMRRDVFDAVTARYAGRIDTCVTTADAFDRYAALAGGGGRPPFVLVESVSDVDVDECARRLHDMLDAGGVVIVGNISAGCAVERLWPAMLAGLSHGMTFTNGRMAVAVGLRHLPRQDFSLWF